MSKTEIGRRLDLDRRTVEKYIRKDAVSKYEKRVIRQRHNRLDEYSEDIITMIDSGATQSNIFKYLLGKGYKGSYSSLTEDPELESLKSENGYMDEVGSRTTPLHLLPLQYVLCK